MDTTHPYITVDIFTLVFMCFYRRRNTNSATAPPPPPHHHHGCLAAGRFLQPSWDSSMRCVLRRSAAVPALRSGRTWLMCPRSLPAQGRGEPDLHRRKKRKPNAFVLTAFILFFLCYTVWAGADAELWNLYLFILPAEETQNETRQPNMHIRMHR